MTVATTAVTATFSTVFLLLFSVPLAYALSRLRFSGKPLILALVDLPIIIPQSAAGIVLLRACGRQQPLGELLAESRRQRHGKFVIKIGHAKDFLPIMPSPPPIVQRKRPKKKEPAVAANVGLDGT